MQFAVPQFTDVEDKIVAGLSFMQFGIVFGAGALIFAVYTISKNISVTIPMALLLGLPALILAFGRVNGRPIYAIFGPLFSYITGGKLYVFHKQAKSLPQDYEVEMEVTEKPAQLGGDVVMVRLKKMNYILQQQASQEQVLLERIALNNQAAQGK